MELEEITPFLELHQLPSSYVDIIERYFFPLAEKLCKHQKGAKAPLVIGINGTQGSGKTTLSEFLVYVLSKQYGLNVAGVSLDDFYLTKQQRKQLANDVHPLFETRGVPGTHDLPLAMQTLTDLINGEATHIPRFNKAIDDRFDQKEWDCVDEKLDVIIFEGWCLGADAQLPEALIEPVNELEQLEDAECIWRSYINQQLLNHYPHLFNLIDHWVMLKAPSFDCVYNWRLEQEQKLRSKLELAAESVKKSVMSDDEVAKFIRFYQRITEQLLKTLPEKIQDLFELDEQRNIIRYTSSQAFHSQPKQNSLLIFTDMDGSLLNHHDYNFESAKPLLIRLRNQHIPVIPCTSKTSEELFSLREQMQSETPFIIENGAAIYIPLGTFLQQPKDTIRVKEYWVKAFTQPRAHWLSLLEKLTEKYSGCFKSFKQMSLEEIMAATDLDEVSAQQAGQREYGEPVMWLADEATKQNFITDLEKLGATVLQGGRFIHVSGRSNKGQALQWLAEQYRTASFMKKPITTLAIGDSQNDIAMLEAADIALTIPSLTHELPKLERENNSYIADTIAPDGWQQGVEKILNDLKRSSKEMNHG